MSGSDAAPIGLGGLFRRDTRSVPRNFWLCTPMTMLCRWPNLGITLSDKRLCGRSIIHLKINDLSRALIRAQVFVAPAETKGRLILRGASNQFSAAHPAFLYICDRLMVPVRSRLWKSDWASVVLLACMGMNLAPGGSIKLRVRPPATSRLSVPACNASRILPCKTDPISNII